MTTGLQKAIAGLCGTDVTGLSERSAAVRLRLTLAGDLLSVYPEKPATEQQVELEVTGFSDELRVLVFDQKR